jgi:NAD(P)-dependent dehydrogenase (short-subunit alcohol dehydrogenase family)
MKRFDGRVALVTGAASGIGHATAIALAAQGAAVVLADVDEEGGAKVTAELGEPAFFQRCDVGKSEDVANLISTTIDRQGRLDLAVNNAGIEGARAFISNYDEANWQRVIDVNLSGVFYCMKHEMRVMLAQGGGAIVNVSSIFGQVAATQAAAYVAAKHGVIGLTKAGALEGATSGIRVNAVCPGYISTPMVMERAMAAATNPHVMQAILDKQPSGRLGSPEEVAAAILWLLSDDASYINGQSLGVEGAYLAR